MENKIKLKREELEKKINAQSCFSLEEIVSILKFASLWPLNILLICRISYFLFSV